MIDALDEQFIKRVYRTSTILWLVGLAMCAEMRSATGAIGLTVGFGISLGSLMLWERLVKLIAAPEAVIKSRSTKRLLVFAFLKYAIIGLAIWASLSSGWASPVAMAVGIGLPYAVIFLKAIGMAISFGRN